MLGGRGLHGLSQTWAVAGKELKVGIASGSGSCTCSVVQVATGLFIFFLASSEFWFLFSLALPLSLSLLFAPLRLPSSHGALMCPHGMWLVCRSEEHSTHLANLH